MANLGCATCRLRTSFVDGHRSAAKVTAVQGGDGSLGFVCVRHFDETKSSGSARFTISHNTGPFNGSVIFKRGAKSLFRRPETEVTYKYVCHVFSCDLKPANRAGTDNARTAIEATC